MEIFLIILVLFFVLVLIAKSDKNLNTNLTVTNGRVIDVIRKVDETLSDINKQMKTVNKISKQLLDQMKDLSDINNNYNCSTYFKENDKTFTIKDDLLSELSKLTKKGIKPKLKIVTKTEKENPNEDKEHK